MRTVTTVKRQQIRRLINWYKTTSSNKKRSKYTGKLKTGCFEIKRIYVFLRNIIYSKHSAIKNYAFWYYAFFGLSNLMLSWNQSTTNLYYNLFSPFAFFLKIGWDSYL